MNFMPEIVLGINTNDILSANIEEDLDIKTELLQLC